MADHKRNCLFACIQRVVDCSQKIMLTNFFRPVLLCYKKLLKYIQNITYTQVGTYIINSSLSNDVSRIFFLISLSKSKYLSLFLIRRSREDSSGANLIKVLMLSSSYEYNDADEVGTENVEWRKRHRIVVSPPHLYCTNVFLDIFGIIAEVCFRWFIYLLSLILESPPHDQKIQGPIKKRKIPLKPTKYYTVGITKTTSFQLFCSFYFHYEVLQGGER